MNPQLISGGAQAAAFVAQLTYAGSASVVTTLEFSNRSRTKSRLSQGREINTAPYGESFWMFSGAGAYTCAQAESRRNCTGRARPENRQLSAHQIIHRFCELDQVIVSLRMVRQRDQNIVAARTGYNRAIMKPILPRPPFSNDLNVTAPQPLAEFCFVGGKIG